MQLGSRNEIVNVKTNRDRMRPVVAGDDADRKIDCLQLTLARAKHRIIDSRFQVRSPTAHDINETLWTPRHDLVAAGWIGGNEVLEMIRGADVGHSAALGRFDILCVVDARQPG